MRHFSTATTSGRRFLGDRRGAIGVVFGMLLPVVALGVGFGLNIAQLMTVKSNLQNALDSAVTSTARDLTTGVIPEENARENVEAFLAANGGGAFASVDRIKLDTVDVNKVTNVVSAAASVDVDVLFPLFGANNNQHIAIETAARYSDKKIEVAMMLDVTGSMKKTWRGDKIGDMQDAANMAVEQLLEKNRDPHDPRIRVALLPYATSVNAGGLAATSVFVENGRKDRRQAPGNTALKLASMASRPDNCSTERKGTYQFSDVGPQVAMVNRDSRLDFCPSATVVPLSADKEALQDQIGAYHADGTTAGHIGIQWTWYMLSPEWRGVLPAAAEPGAYHDKKVAKVAILMTDGEFNSAFADVPEREGTTNVQKARSRNKAERLCKAIKDEGIEIFTIGFMLDSGKEVLRNCASPDTGSLRHFYEPDDGEELKATYKEIIDNVENLAIIR